MASRKHQGGGETIALNRTATPLRARLIECLVDELPLLLHAVVLGVRRPVV